jgi:fucose permease
MAYRKKLVFAAACLGMLLFGIVLISLGSILPAITDKFSIDKITAGSLAALLPFGILAGSLVFGPIVDRYGYKNLLIVCAFLVLLGLQGIAYSESFFLLQVSIFLIGFGGGVINGGTNALVADISTEGKGANLSLLGVFFGIGALGMPAILAALSQSFNYDTIISWIGWAVIIPIAFFMIINFPVPKQPQEMPIKQGAGLLKEPVLLMLGFVLFFESGMEGIVNNWTTTYLINTINTNPEEALYALSYFVAGMTITRLLLGAILKKVSAAKVLYTCFGIAFCGTVVLMISSSYSVAVVGLVLLGAGFAAGFPVILGYLGEIYSSLSGTAFSIALVIALIGNMSINYLVGIVSHNFGIEHLTTILLISLILMIILLRITLKKISTKRSLL